MKALKNPYALFGKIALIIGVSFFGVSLLLVLLWVLSRYMYGFGLTALILGFQGLIWSIIGLCVYTPFKSEISRRERIKKDGLCYDAEIVRLLPDYKVHISGYISIYAECIYKNHENRVCLVKSSSFLLENSFAMSKMIEGIRIAQDDYEQKKADSLSGYNNMGSLKAKVYVDRKDPRDYSVEILMVVETSANLKFDYDYR